MEQRFGEVLPPRPGTTQGLGQVEVKFLHGQAAIRKQTAGQILFAQLATDFFIKRFSERREMTFGQRQARSHGMPTELADQFRMARRHCIQRIADVEPRHRTC
ncbi:hypothetical protein D3C81_1916530 [compost metagenome]